VKAFRLCTPPEPSLKDDEECLAKEGHVLKDIKVQDGLQERINLALSNNRSKFSNRPFLRGVLCDWYRHKAGKVVNKIPCLRRIFRVKTARQRMIRKVNEHARDLLIARDVCDSGLYLAKELYAEEARASDEAGTKGDADDKAS
jgi:hypothetical protein